MSEHGETSANKAAGSGTGERKSLLHAGVWTSLISTLAFVFSGVSFYESVIKRAALEVYVPPVIHYGRDGGGDTELFAIPVTISNAGARTGTILSMDLEVESLKPGADPKSKRYYSAYLGEHPRASDAPNKAFAPASIAGRATYSDTIRFYPVGNALPRLVSETGEYRFTLRLNLAEAAEPGFWENLWRAQVKPVTFTLRLPWLSDQQLGFRRGTIAMHAKDHRPFGGTASETAK